MSHEIMLRLDTLIDSPFRVGIAECAAPDYAPCNGSIRAIAAPQSLSTQLRPVVVPVAHISPVAWGESHAYKTVRSPPNHRNLYSNSSS